jgi:hypothetical protein
MPRILVRPTILGRYLIGPIPCTVVQLPGYKVLAIVWRLACILSSTRSVQSRVVISANEPVADVGSAAVAETVGVVRRAAVGGALGGAGVVVAEGVCDFLEALGAKRHVVLFWRTK